jgi:hypothetical protein
MAEEESKSDIVDAAEAAVPEKKLCSQIFKGKLKEEVWEHFYHVDDAKKPSKAGVKCQCVHCSLTFAGNATRCRNHLASSRNAKIAQKRCELL